MKNYKIQITNITVQKYSTIIEANSLNEAKLYAKGFEQRTGDPFTYEDTKENYQDIDVYVTEKEAVRDVDFYDDYYRRIENVERR